MKRILVALDSSEHAPGVLSAALRLAEMTDAKLVVYRAIGAPSSLPRELMDVHDATLEDSLCDAAHVDLERLLEGFPRDRLEKIVTSFATPWDGICTAGREQDADLIVVGSHEYHGLDRILGTSAAKVVNHADRNVLVVRTVL